MGAFIGYNNIGIWASNRERDSFLDWYAEHRCTRDDARWNYCTSSAQRWMGRCIELEELIPFGESFEVTEAEFQSAANDFSPHVAQLLVIISQITSGKWLHLVSSKEAINWRDA